MGKLAGILVGFFGMLFLLAALNTLIIKIAWAYSVTPMFGIREPGWVEAFALAVLTASLFKSSSVSKS